MRKINHINLTSSALAAGLILLSLFLLNPHDLVIQIIGFIVLQMAMGLSSILLIFMRITSLFKNRGAWLYYFSGTTQTGLCITDITLLLLSHSLIKSSLLIFLALNGILAAIIF